MKKLPQIALYLCLFALPFFTSCHQGDPVDLCETLVCLNDGVCANGKCNCPDGYTGVDCGSQKVPAKIRITKIRVTRIPLTNNGEPWDLDQGWESAPDINILIERNGVKFYEHPHYIWNADPSLPHEFKPAPLYHIDMLHPTDTYKITLFDFEAWYGNLEYMGSLEYIPYSDGNHFPQSLTLDEGGDVAFELVVEYIF